MARKEHLTSQAAGLLPITESTIATANKLVWEPTVTDVRLNQLKREFHSKAKADADRFECLESMFGNIQERLAQVGKSHEQSLSK